MKTKYFFSFIINKISIAMIFLRLFLILKVGRYNSYQYDYFFKGSKKYGLECKHRLNVIKKNLFEIYC